MGRTRPVVVRLHALRNGWPVGSAGLLCVRSTKLCSFIHIRQPPVTGTRSIAQPAATVSQPIGIRQRCRPVSGSKTVGVLQPDQRRQVVRHRPIAIVREPHTCPRRRVIGASCAETRRNRWIDPSLVLSVLACASTGNLCSPRVIALRLTRLGHTPARARGCATAMISSNVCIVPLPGPLAGSMNPLCAAK